MTLSVDHERARFDRSPLAKEGSDAARTSPGARISFATDAVKAFAVFEYLGTHKCLPDCVVAADGTCFESKKMCRNQCELLLEVDGKQVDAKHTNLVGMSLTHDHENRDFFGEIRVALVEQAEAVAHNFSLELPWGTPVDLRRIHLAGQHNRAPNDEFAVSLVVTIFTDVLHAAGVYESARPLALILHEGP